MGVSLPGGPSPTIGVDVAALRRFWVLYLILGILMTMLGFFIIGSACLAEVTTVVTWVFGIMLIVTGVTEILSSFSTGRWSGTLVHLLIGLLYGIVGFAIVDNPLLSAVVLTRIIAIFLMVGGAFRILSALTQNFASWGWVFLNGCITLALGIMIYREWPASGLWFIGLCVGIDLLLNGWSWIMLSLGLRRLQPE